MKFPNRYFFTGDLFKHALKTLLVFVFTIIAHAVIFVPFSLEDDVLVTARLDLFSVLSFPFNW